MKHQLRNSNGSALLIAVAVLMIFTILGLSLLTLTSNGLAKNETRENIVQATDLADKGIEYAVNDIQKTLEDEIINNPMGKTDFGKFLEKTLKKPALQCTVAEQASIGYEILTDNQSYTSVCIQDVDKISYEEKDAYKRIVTFKSTGYVNGKEKTIRTQVIIGTDAIPDQLRYAVSSNDGSLYIHGGVEITGDIKSEKDIHISKNAFSSWRSDPTWHNSVPLRMIPSVGSVSSKIIFSNPDNKLYYYDKDLGTNNSWNAPQNNKEKDSVIKYFPKNNPKSIFSVNSNSNISSVLTRSDKTNILSKDLPKDVIDVTGSIEKVYNNSKYDYLIEGSTVEGNTSKLKKNEQDNILITDLVCTSSAKNCLKNKMAKTTLNIKGKDVELQGTYYINGNVVIENANLKNNAILYVNGSVNIRFSTINGLNTNNTLIIFATDEIFIANISEYSNNYSEIKGFFFSQQDMTLYGIGSNIQITGGISANNLFLTAVRGSVTKVNNSPKTIDASSQLKEGAKSRLKIIYDADVIDQYTQFKRDEEEEFITQLNDPEVLNRY